MTFDRTLTVQLDEATVRKARVAAAKRGRSISRLVAEQIDLLARQDDDYERAMQDALAELERGFDLGGDPGHRPVHGTCLRRCWVWICGQELYVKLTRRLRVVIPPRVARELVGRYGRWPVDTVATGDILEAIDLGQRHSLSFRDAPIVVAAIRSDAERLLSEDLRHDRTIGGVRSENPFVR